MSDGVLVVDAQDRIVDLNPAAQRPAGHRLRTALAMPAAACWRSGPPSSPRATTPTAASPKSHWMPGAFSSPTSASPLCRDRHGRVTGRLLVIRDISRRKQAEAGLAWPTSACRSSWRRSTACRPSSARRRFGTSLPPLFNRRYLEETLPRELSRAARDHCPLSLVILDIDDFKQLNDKYGHEAGDTVLKAIGPFLRGQIRIGDIACRYGGEEFVVVMPNTPAGDRPPAGGGMARLDERPHHHLPRRATSRHPLRRRRRLSRARADRHRARCAPPTWRSTPPSPPAGTGSSSGILACLPSRRTLGPPRATLPPAFAPCPAAILPATCARQPGNFTAPAHR